MKVALTILCALLLIGCSTKPSAQAAQGKPTMFEATGSMYVWCDYQKGVEYIGVTGGLSVRYNENGQPSRCSR